MTTIFCNACGAESDCTQVKCEQCSSRFSDEKYAATDDWEDDFRFIEEAELKSEIYNIEHFEEGFCKSDLREDGAIVQYIKEEPEIHIGPDIEIQMKLDATDHADKMERVQHQCSECKKRFKYKAKLTAHFNAVHCQSDSGSEEWIPQRKLISKSKIKVFTCKICNKVSKDNEQHLKHLETHKNRKISLPSGLIKCDECNKTFSNNFEFKMHRNQHEGKKVFQCDICDAVLSKESILKQHKIKLHSGNIENTAGEKKYRCAFCGERFPFQVLMTNHKKTHHEYTKQIEETAIVRKVAGRLTYICNVCGKSSSNKSRHTDHLRVHTKEKPFKCELCGSGFTTRGTLVVHLRLHSQDRPFKCHICEATYRHKKNLRKHLFRHTGARPFKCKYCDRTFALKTIKVDHERQLHTGETPYQCDVCKCWFTTSSLLNVHRRTKHDIDTNSKPRVKILINNSAACGSESSGEVMQ